MLARGGSATDAAIAIMLALTVVEPQSSGIGGGGFMVRGTADGVVSTFDGRETAPAGATPEWFLDASGEFAAAQRIGPQRPFGRGAGQHRLGCQGARSAWTAMGRPVRSRPSNSRAMGSR